MSSYTKTETSYIIYSGSSGGPYFAKNGATGKVDYSGSNGATVLQNAISAVTGSGGKIFIKQGIYNIGSTTLEISFNASTPKTVIIEGDGSGPHDTVIKGSATKLLDVTNTAWIAGKESPLFLRNLRFEHDTSGATDIGLDLEYSNPYLENIIVRNVDATRQGTGIKAGPTSNAGRVYWRDVNCNFWDTGSDIALDHLIADNLQQIGNEIVGFYIHNCFHSTFRNCHSYAPTLTTDYTFLIKYVGSGILIDNPVAENIPDVCMFHMDASQSYDSKARNVNIPAGVTSAQICDNWNVIDIEGGSSGCITKNNGYVSIDNGEDVAHGLVATPTVVNIFASGSTPTQFSWLPSGSDGFYVYHDAGGAIGVFWEAKM